MGRIMNRQTNRSSKVGFRSVSVACIISECGFCNVYKLCSQILNFNLVLDVVEALKNVLVSILFTTVYWN